MIPTPDLSHLTQQDYEHVYEPAEDTFLLLDAIEEEADKLKQLHPLVCLEVGSGSGCVSAFIGGILGSSAACAFYRLIWSKSIGLRLLTALTR